GTFVNNGVLTIENTAAGSSAGSPNGNIEAQLTVENTAAEFTNNGLITIHNNASVADTASYTQQAALTVANGAIFTNTGTILITGDANKTVAKASLDLGANNYTAAAGSLTVLANDAQLKAASVIINGGTFDGAGEILAATTVSAGGVLAPSGTLTLNSLTLDDGGIVNFSITDGDLLDITHDLTLSGATLQLTDSALAEGLYLLANYGDTRTGDALTISGLSDYNYALNFDTPNQVFLNITIPEPSAWALLLTGAALLAVLRRRR
ncbi:MAG: PEP-CTERM sorting domain-containing protein, partial [Verrucomicrobiales bacterium]|nr:PEP-CTERM sorting domain-containing protein [Verrucomicrobiales bacterium]